MEEYMRAIESHPEEFVGHAGMRRILDGKLDAAFQTAFDALDEAAVAGKVTAAEEEAAAAEAAAAAGSPTSAASRGGKASRRKEGAPPPLAARPPAERRPAKLRSDSARRIRSLRRA
eukprot:PLAT4436.2.p1 GENE.PLAT4436.2~~PLAT4436.2.p1  ORF type:complete len:117 (-),score=47.10 PLAT4436.2:97-447(-)